MYGVPRQSLYGDPLRHRLVVVRDQLTDDARMEHGGRGLKHVQVGRGSTCDKCVIVVCAQAG